MAEILAPAGTKEAFTAAMKAGADAVYLGGDRFGARAYAGNFDEQTLLKTLDEAHLFGKKIYLTVNTLVKENEMDELYSFILPYYRAGLDAVIVQDIGAMKMIRESFKDLPIHVSTQMTVTGAYGASLLREYGAARVVPARELSLLEIKNIRADSNIEIECFVHGALCYCYSGQCLMSSMAGGRSGNRGKCAQPCRLPYTVYKNGRIISEESSAYALNTRDICTLDLLPDLLSAGIDSFKIEGRMKRPEYVAGVTSVYRKYHDLAQSRDSYKIAEEDRKLLFHLFNREGFSQSYYRQHNGPDMMALHNQKRSKKENERTEKSYLFVQNQILNKERKKELTAKCLISGGTAELTFFADGKSGTAVSQDVLPARTKELTGESVQKQIQKTGGTPFTVSRIITDIEPGVFMTIGALNELRRAALQDFERQIYDHYARKESDRREKTSVSFHNSDRGDRIKKKELSVLVNTADQYRAVLKSEDIDEIVLPAALAEILFRDELPKSGTGSKSYRLCLPSPLRENGIRVCSKVVTKAADAGWNFLAGSLEEIAWLISLGLAQRIRSDAGIYTMNHKSRVWLQEHGITKDTVPYELNRHEIRSRDNTDSELVVYGRIPLMISAQCLQKNYTGQCAQKTTQKNEEFINNGPALYLKDRKNYNYPVFADCSVCRNILYNPFPLSLLSRKEEVESMNAGSYRFVFTDEKPEAVRDRIAAWVSGEPYMENFEFTRGHFGRGI